MVSQESDRIKRRQLCVYLLTFGARLPLLGWLYAYLGDFLLDSGRRTAKRSAVGFYPHVGLQPALRLVRHALHLLESRRKGDESGRDPSRHRELPA